MALRVDFAHPLRNFVATVDLSVARGATLALVGPSGAGKTTVLRVIAGLLRPERGQVTLDGETWLDSAQNRYVPPERRRVGYLFQEYALFPHLDVAGNVAFGARRPELADEMLHRLGIGHLAKARPRELSGGERQRTALARALAREPRVLLLDEPLSALDAHTKASVRLGLYEQLHDLELPTILVTHDFEDAAALADEIGVMVDGRILQIGTVTELVATPTDAFVATFTGATLLPGCVVGSAEGVTEILLDSGATAWSADPGSGRVNVVVYPWEVSLARQPPNGSALNHIRGPVASIVPLGDRVRVRVGPVVAEITAASARRLKLREGDTLVASFKATSTRLLGVP